jgi:prefoldin subunit 5
MAQHTDRTMGQIEALQMQIGELEREANKQSSTGAALEHADQAEEREVE